MAEALADAGASVVLVGRRTSALSEVEDGIAGRAGSCASVPVDLADRQELLAAAERCADIFGEPDILVNAAGVNNRPPLGSVTLEDWDATMAVNLTAAFVLGQRFGPPMADRGYGRIINLGSQQSFRAFGNSGAYGVSKAGIVALTRSQAEAWSRHGVCCNAVVPGFVHTPMTEAVFSDPTAGGGARSAHNGGAQWQGGRLSRRSRLLGERRLGIRDRSGHLCGRRVLVHLTSASERWSSAGAGTRRFHWLASLAGDGPKAKMWVSAGIGGHRRST